MNPVKYKHGKTTKAAFGDFQTPLDLAKEICAHLVKKNVHFKSVLEPNCGIGSFLIAAADIFPHLEKIVGADINTEHLNSAKQDLKDNKHHNKVEFINKDFFHNDWEALLKTLPEPILLIGNPPWVTNSGLSVLGSNNRPHKSNFQDFKGLDAVTGKSNFDISEWMLNKEIEWISGMQRTVAMLCKISVARKVLLRAWNQKFCLGGAEIYYIDASKHFGASVDACLLVVHGTNKETEFQCKVYKSLQHNEPDTIIGYADNHLIADMEAFNRGKHLEGKSQYQWRSGIKHDCAKVMELTRQENGYRNGLGELIELEPDYLYPMLKGSQIANGPRKDRHLWMLVPQQHPSDETISIRFDAPKTWEYLVEHSDLLDRRASSIYKKRSRFSVFGVGDYSFAKWKVAISGFYKKLDFKVVGPYEGKPVVFDDTCYFLACQSEEEAVFLAKLYNCDVAKDFYSAFIFWDEKRPINLGILKRLNIIKLSEELKTASTLNALFQKNNQDSMQLSLFP